MNGSGSLFSTKLSALSIRASDADSAGDTAGAITSHAALIMEGCRCILQARSLADLQQTPDGRARVASDAIKILQTMEQSIHALQGLIGNSIAPGSAAFGGAQPAAPSPFPATPSPFPTIPSGGGGGRALPPAGAKPSPFPTIPTAGGAQPSPFPRAPGGASPMQQQPRFPQPPANDNAARAFPAAPAGASAPSSMPAFGMEPAAPSAMTDTLQMLQLMPGVSIDSSKTDVFNNLTRAEVDRINRVVADFKRECQMAQRQLEEKRQRLEGTPEKTRVSVMANLKLEAMRKQKEVEYIARSRQMEVIQAIIQEHLPKPSEQELMESRVDQSIMSRVRDTPLFQRAADLYEQQRTRSQAKKDYEQVVQDGGNVSALRTNVKRYLEDPEHPLGKRLRSFANDFPHMRFPDKATLLQKLLAFRDKMTTEAENHLSLNSQSVAHDVVQELTTETLVCLLYQPIYEAYTKEYTDEDQISNQKLAQYSSTVTPQDVGVKRRFWLVDESEMGNAGDAAAMAYKVPADILRSIGRVESPYEKIRCVLNALREINSRVQCFFNAHGNTKPVEMGADELTEIFMYCMLKSGLKNMNTEYHMMEDFILGSMERNEDGFAVATFAACVSAIGGISL